MEVNFIISESIRSENIGNGIENNMIINPVNVLVAKIIPTSLSFGLVVVTSGLKIDQRNTFEIELINLADDSVIYTTGQNILQKFPENAHNFTFSLDLKNIDITHEGFYKVLFKFNGETYSREFEVVQYDQSR